MNIKALLATSVVAIAPFAFAQKAEAAKSDCWHGEANTTLTHEFCEVTRRTNGNVTTHIIQHPAMGATWSVILYVHDWNTPNERPDFAQIEIKDWDDGEVVESRVRWLEDSDGDYQLISNNLVFVFRAASHPRAGTAWTRSSAGGNNRPAGGIRQGDLRDTPFRF